MMKKYKPNYVRIANKLLSLVLVGLGLAVMFVDGEATFLVFMTIVGGFVFFSKSNIMGV